MSLPEALYQDWFATGARSEICHWMRGLRLADPGSGAGGPAYEILEEGECFGWLCGSGGMRVTQADGLYTVQAHAREA